MGLDGANALRFRTRAHRVAAADRAAVQEVQLAIAAKPDQIDAGFWRAVLGYAPMAEVRLAAALAAGGRVVDASNAPRWWTLSDSAGNRVCVCGWPDGSDIGG